MCRCGCGVEVAPPRRTFNSDECVERYKIRNDPGYVRNLVEQRDHGVCALCGLDTEALRRQIDYRPEAYRELLVAKGFRATAYCSGDFWAADHIIPVAEGGGGCGLDGYRTLCTPCHKRVTAELVQRLAEQRRLAKESARQPLFQDT